MDILRTYKGLILAVLLLIAWSIALWLIPANALVEWVGVENTYLFAFLISAIAGFSTFTGTAAYAAVIEFSQGGAHPLYLGLSAGVGLFLSDSAFYFLAMKGRDAVRSRIDRLTMHTERLIRRVPDYAVYIATFVFCAFGPIPNDLVIAVLIVAGYRYRSFWPALLAGDVVFMLSLSHLFQ